MVMTPNPCKTLKQHPLLCLPCLKLLSGFVPSHNISGKLEAVYSKLCSLSWILRSHSSEWKFRTCFLHWEVHTKNILSKTSKLPLLFAIFDRFFSPTEHFMCL